MTTIHFTLALAAYYTLHSLLAADSVKARLAQLVPPRYYRLCYNGLAAGLLAIIFILYFLVEKRPLWSPNQVLPYPGGLLALAGIIWVVKALAGYNLGEFTGLEQLKTGSQPRHETLVISGLNAQVRHPLYFGMLLVVWGILFILPTDAMLAFCLVSTAYLYVGGKLEERKLVAQFGEAYQKYQREVPMLVPFRWRMR